MEAEFRYHVFNYVVLSDIMRHVVFIDWANIEDKMYRYEQINHVGIAVESDGLGSDTLCSLVVVK
jgi:hypothetical protein